MPDVAPHSPPAEDLDKKVETLLQQMEDAARQTVSISDAAPPPGDADGEATAGVGPPGPDIDSTEADLMGQVDHLLAEATKDGVGPTLGDLDEKIAAVAGSLAGGEEIDPPVAAPPEVPAREARPAPVEPPGVAVPVKRPAGSAASARRMLSVLAMVEPAAYRIAAVVSAPLKNRPALLREAVGWAALVTMFYAGCVYVYFLAFYEPHAPAPTLGAVSLVESGSAASGGHAAPAPASDGGHAATARPARKSALKRPDKNKSLEKMPPGKRAEQAAKGASHGTGH